jgi:diguanylate cyclase (GGDEF)-like protein
MAGSLTGASFRRIQGWPIRADGLGMSPSSLWIWSRSTADFNRAAPQWFTRLAVWLPRGTTLPAQAWAVRHRWVVAVLVIQTLLLPAFALLQGFPLHHALLEAVPSGLLASAACVPRLGIRVRSAAAAVGLMVVSGVVVHLSGGAIEAHFHFFVMIPVVALYESWVPFSLAVGYVLFQHGIVGTLDAHSVYNHQDAHQHPWQWAGIHAGLFAAACVGAIVNWRLHETAREHEMALSDLMGHQAQHDPLTGLANRACLLDLGQQLIDTCSVTGTAVSVLLIDLDRFKEVNDTLGHECGDQLLREIGPRLQSALRDGDLLVRLGGDEFALVLPAADERVALDVAQRLLRTLDESFVVGGIDLDVGASIGVAVFQPDPDGVTTTINDQLRLADIAMYTAKDLGCGSLTYHESQDQNSLGRLSLMSELRRALQDETDQIVLHFQPLVGVQTGQPVGVEALVRWQHPTRGLLLPAEFLPQAENTSLMTLLTDVVLDRALAALGRWTSLGHVLTVSVNISARTLLDRRLLERIDRLCSARGADPSMLRLELVETSLMADTDSVLATLGALSRRGIRISVDDFGTGYSSMSRLQSLPIDELKIDRSFILAMGAGGVMPGQREDARAATEGGAIVRSTIDLGHQLGMSVVAEGVEDQETLNRLAEAGCDVAQGFHIARPMPEAALLAWLAITDATATCGTGVA